MNTRKTSSRKSRLPRGGPGDTRLKTGTKTIPEIPTFFQSEENDVEENSNNVGETESYDVMPSPIEPLVEVQESKVNLKSRVGTRLSTFLQKEEKPTTRRSNMNDFETPQKNIKKAPKAKAKPRPKRQTKIKSTFFKTEEIFSEITAQHCRADNVNPDEMQMVLALSMSEAEANGTSGLNDDAGGTEDIRDKLKKFGFRTGLSEDYRLDVFLPTKKRTKWANRFTALTLRNPQRQMEKLNQKVQDLLGLQFPSHSPPQGDVCPTYVVFSDVLRRLVPSDPVIIWPDDKERTQLVDFYVLSLFEPSRTKVGYLLKDVRLIPGRDSSPNRRKTAHKPDQLTDKLDTPLNSPAIKKNRLENVSAHELPHTCPIVQHTSVDIPCIVSSLPIDLMVDHDEDHKISQSVSKSVPSMDIVDATLAPQPACELSFNDTALDDAIVDTLSTIDKLSEEIIQTQLGDNENSSQSPTQLSSIRPTSPDIFADSDVEMETACLNVSRTSSSSHQITTYELFSSDEVKISLATRLSSDNLDPVPTIDLTQCGSDSTSQHSKEGISTLENEYIPPTISSINSILKEEALPSMSLYERISFSDANAFGELPDSSASIPSIDLTQNSEDECIHFSDDEVNYSIWKTDRKSLYIAPIDSDDDDFGLQNVSIDRLLNQEDNNEFSFADLVADSQPPTTPPTYKSDSNLRTNSNTSFDSLDLDLSKRSDFGILEEISPFKTPTKTPKKRERSTPASTSAKCRKVLSESFISSPKVGSPIYQRFSSSKKFSEFVRSDEDSLSDLDDIDKLIYGSPSKKVYKKPAGLDQLLTGAINCPVESPKKPEPQSPKEFEFNGRTYLVHTTNVNHKPDFESMDDVTLLDQLFRYGIKPLKRKQALRMLEYIYNQTHPSLVDEDCSHGDTPDIGSELKGTSKFNLQDCFGHRLITEGPTPFMEIEDERYILQTNTTKKVSTALLPFHIAWHNLVKSNKELHEAILHYEPIDLQEIYLFFKNLGYRYDPKDLKYFFDSRSIVFRYDLNKGDPSAGANRHVRKKRPKLTQAIRW